MQTHLLKKKNQFNLYLGLKMIIKRIFYTLLTLILSPVFIFLVIFLGGILIGLTFLYNNKKTNDFILWLWTKLSLLCFRIKVTSIKGAELIPKGSCLFLFNHTSHVDILVLQNIIPSVRFGAKIELYKIPIFGYAMKRVGVLPIARNNLEEVKKIYNNAKMRTEHGERFALAPEGTRQFSPYDLGKFKSGPFIFAIEAGIPIIPVFLKGCYDVMPKTEFLPSLTRFIYPVEVEFGNPINVDENLIDDRDKMKLDLQNKTRIWFESRMH